MKQKIYKSYADACLENIISHNYSYPLLDTTAKDIRHRLICKGDSFYAKLDEKLSVLRHLQKFPLGKYIIQNAALSEYWQDSLIHYPHQIQEGLVGDDISTKNFIDYITHKWPLTLALREKNLFLHDFLQKKLRHNIRMGSIPCGLMRDVLRLDFSDVRDFTLTGIDTNEDSLDFAHQLSLIFNIEEHCQFYLEDCLSSDLPGNFDIISNAYLSISQSNPIDFYAMLKSCYKALNEGGLLIASYLTPPPHLLCADNCEWALPEISSDDLGWHQIISEDILCLKNTHYQSTKSVKFLLHNIGFHKVDIHYDKACMLPTFIAKK